MLKARRLQRSFGDGLIAGIPLALGGAIDVLSLKVAGRDRTDPAFDIRAVVLQPCVAQVAALFGLCGGVGHRHVWFPLSFSRRGVR